jgi:hypothetical protein
MGMTKDDLGRRFLLDVCANGSVHIRERGRPISAVDALLPVYSTDTHEEAVTIRVRHCKLARDGSGLYFLNESPRDVSDLARVSDLFRETHRKAAR